MKANVRKKNNKKKMSDIAQIAGVSESTVSRALNNNPLINIKTRERIQAIAADQNYSINRQAQNLRLQSSQTIAVIMPVDHKAKQNVSDPFFLELLGAIADILAESQYDLLLSHVNKNNWREKVAHNNYVDGVIIMGQSDLHDDINTFAKETELPIAVWGAKQAHQHYITVGSNNILGGKLATQRLIERNCKNILFLGDIAYPEAQGRYLGYKQALEQADITINENHYKKCGFNRQNSIDAMQEILNSKLIFDGIFAANDLIASSIVSLLTKAGYQIPSDCCIVGYDDIEFAAHVSPSLTTVSQNIHDGAKALVNAVFAQINNKPTESIIIPPQLISRETS